MSNSVNYTALFKNDKNAERFPAGTVLFQEGDLGDCMYVVKSGTVDIKDGDAVLETVGEGAIFGEMALLDSEPRSASAVVAEDAELVCVDPRRFQFLVQNTPYFAIHVMRVMAARLRRRTKAAVPA